MACAFALPFIGRIDQRRPPAIGLAVLAIGNGPSIIAGNFVLLLVVRITLGVGAACVVRTGSRGRAGGLAVAAALGCRWQRWSPTRPVFVLLAASGTADALLGVPFATIDRHPIGEPRVVLTAGLKVIFRAAASAVFTLLSCRCRRPSRVSMARWLTTCSRRSDWAWRSVPRRFGECSEGGLADVDRTLSRLRGGLPLVHCAAAVLGLRGAAAGAADAAMRGLIGDPVLDGTAGWLGVGLVSGAGLGTSGPGALPQVAAALAVVVSITTAVGPAANSRREGHRGPGALSPEVRTRGEQPAP